MPALTSMYPNFLDTTIEKLEIAFKNLDKKSYWRQLVTLKSTKKLVEKNMTLENMGAASVWPEMSDMPDMSFKEGQAQAFTQQPLAGSVLISKLMKEFGQYDLITRLTQQLGDSITKAEEIIISDYFNYGDTAIASVPTAGSSPIINSIGADGKVLFYSAHTWASTGGNTWRNVSVAADALTETAIETAYAVIEGWTDNNGFPMGISMKRLIIHPTDHGAAIRILQSSYQPATGNNAVNVAPKLVEGGFMVYPHLTDGIGWFIETDAKDCGIQVFQGIPKTVRRGVENDRDMIDYISAFSSWAHGVTDMHRYHQVGS